MAERAARPLHWASLREAGLSAGLWFLYGVYRCGGRWLYRLILWPVAFYFTLTRGVARRASVEYLQRIGQLASDAPLAIRWWHVTRHIERFADALLDKALAWTGALDLDAMELDVDPRFFAAERAGVGGVLVVAHCGNLEVLRALARRLPTLRMKILVHTRHAQRFNRLLARLNPASAANLLQVTELDAAAAAELSECVEGGEFVVIAADRVPVGARPGPTLAIPFLGRPAPLPVGPWVLAAALGCPVYWLSCLKAEGRYTLRCELLFERIEMPRAQRLPVLTRVMTAYAQRLEQACRAAPYSWFNFYPFWAPAGGRS
ncbi:MAG TPA: acyltransferase [Burkholderiaceae bacterium]|nr:acyltransferase [Burkholderiaceae bacterium]